jgi:hypothetical protein
MRLQGLDKLKKLNDFIGIRTRDLPTCNIVPQLTKLPRFAARNPVTNGKAVMPALGVQKADILG